MSKIVISGAWNTWMVWMYNPDAYEDRIRLMGTERTLLQAKILKSLIEDSEIISANYRAKTALL